MSVLSLAALPAGLIPDDAAVRVRVLVGEDADAARRNGKVVIARSDCTYYCPDAATVARCIEALRESDERLRTRPDEQMLWDWECTYYEADLDNQADGGTVILGVAWYDPEFYAERREAWLGTMHKHVYADIGVALDDITVTHWRLDPAT